MISVLAALLVQAAARPAAPELWLVASSADCEVRSNGQPLDWRDPAALTRHLSGVEHEWTKVVIVGQAATGYRCIGGLVYTMQMRGFREVEYRIAPNPRPAR